MLTPLKSFLRSSSTSSLLKVLSSLTGIKASSSTSSLTSLTFKKSFPVLMIGSIIFSLSSEAVFAFCTMYSDSPVYSSLIL